jgi:hypothetical protein
MRMVLEASNDGGKTWKRWPNDKAAFTEAEARAKIRKQAESTERLKALDAERIARGGTSYYNNLELQQLRSTPEDEYTRRVSQSCAEARQQPASVLEAFRKR